MYPAFLWRVFSWPRGVSRGPVLISRTAVKAIVGSRLQARRCDYSFVFAVLVQTSVGKV